MPQLPQAVIPEYEMQLISTGAKIKYRPFLVKEEKLLLMAGDKKDPNEMFEAIKRVLAACTFDKVKINDLPMFDIEYLFIQIRSKSVGETVSPIVVCPHCKKETEIKLDVSKAEIIKNPTHNRRIVIDENAGVSVIMKYPSFNSLAGSKNSINQFIQGEASDTHIYDMILNCIESIIIRNKETEKDDVYHAAETDRGDLEQFIENLTSSSFKKIENFFKTMPQIVCKVNFVCPKCKEASPMEVSNLNDFFGS